MSDTQRDPQDSAEELAEAELVEEDLLVEDVSIDGMCGVY
jgi:mycofactocin precursor